MVKRYLENYKSLLLDEKRNCDDEFKELEQKLRESVEFREILDKKNDPNFEALTPYVLNKKNKEKMAELETEEKEIMKRQEALKLHLNEILDRMAELDSVIAVASENQKAEDSFEKEMDYNEIFRLKILETQENERQRIARDLHDSSVQNMTNLVHKMELCSKLIELDPIRCKLELMTMSKITHDIIDEMRNMIYDLRPMSFDDIGLDVTIERELQRIKSATNVNINFVVEGEQVSLKPVVGITLLRIIQEACNNTIKYADANLISVKLKFNEHAVSITIADDGKGFDLNHIEPGDRNTGFGLPMMRERVYLLSGNIRIDSNEKDGTTILVEVPLKEEDV